MVKIKGGKRSIDEIKKSIETKKNSGGNRKFTDRIPKEGGVTVRFLEDMDQWEQYYTYYNPAVGFPVLATEDNEDLYEGELGLRPTLRYLAPALLNPGSAEEKVGALEVPASLESQLISIYDRKGSLTEYNVFLDRTGTGKNTTYSAQYDERGPIDLDKYEAPDLFEFLKEMANSSASASADTANFVEDDNDVEDEPKESPVPAKKKIVIRKRG